MHAIQTYIHNNACLYLVRAYNGIWMQTRARTMFGEGGNLSLGIYFYKMAPEQPWFIRTETVKQFNDSVLYLEWFHL